LAKKVKQKKDKNNPIEHFISTLCRADPVGPICTIFGMWGQTADLIIQVKFLFQGFGGYGCLKSGVFH